MKRITTIIWLIFCLIGSSSLAQIAGSNYTFNNFKKKPIIRYSSANNKMYMLSEQHFNPGVFSLDTLNYASDLWGNLSTSIVASDFIVEDNGDLVFVKDNGSDIELFSTDLNGQLLWSEISTGITPGVITDLKLVQGVNSYWMHQESEWMNEGFDIYKFESNTWTQLLSPDPIYDFEVNSLDQPHILSVYYNPGGAHKVQFHDGANWQLRYDTTILGSSVPLISQFCIDSSDSLHIVYAPSVAMLWVEYFYLAELHGNTITTIDSMTVSTEQVTALGILLDHNENPHITMSHQGFGPNSGVSVYHTCGNNIIQDYFSVFLFPNDPISVPLARSYSMALDNDNCMHMAYDFTTTLGPPDTTNARVTKYCLFENSQNTISQNGFELSSDILLNVEYQWLDCNNNYSAIAGATDSIYDASAGGSFALEAYQNGCADTSECITVSGVGIDEYGLNSDIQLYPNPSTGLFHVKGNGLNSIEIVDAMGRSIYLRSNLSTNNHTVSLPKAKGTYIIRIDSDQGTFYRRIVLN